jgi:hypothetical protein
MAFSGGKQSKSPQNHGFQEFSRRIIHDVSFLGHANAAKLISMIRWKLWAAAERDLSLCTDASKDFDGSLLRHITDTVWENDIISLGARRITDHHGETMCPPS